VSAAIPFPVGYCLLSIVTEKCSKINNELEKKANSWQFDIFFYEFFGILMAVNRAARLLGKLKRNDGQNEAL